MSGSYTNIKNKKTKNTRRKAKKEEEREERTEGRRKGYIPIARASIKRKVSRLLKVENLGPGIPAVTHIVILTPEVSR